MQYTIEMNYNARFVAVVNADDEGQALDKARTMAEEADMHDFNLTEERESRIINQQ